MVPQDPSGLIRRLGGRAEAAAKLDYFLRELNGSAGATHTNHALLGNEPTLQTPWLYDWMQRPFRTQGQVRRALLGLYGALPEGYPGNDDLGTLSSWYVFGALGLYPEVPGVGLLAIGSPLFGRATVAMPHHKHFSITATAYTFRKVKGRKRGGPTQWRKVALPPAQAPYIRSLSLNNRPYVRPWTIYCALARGGRLAFILGPRPNRKWGDSAVAVPPSFGPHRRMPSGACTP
jgi:putative alpha-1,2-mannosidase